MTNPSEIFVKQLGNHNIEDVLRIPFPDIVHEQETGAIYPAADQTKFFFDLEEWIVKNESFLVHFLKEKRREEKDRAQAKFDFLKDL